MRPDPLDADRLDAIQAAAQEANGDGVTWKLADPERPDGHEVLVDYAALASLRPLTEGEGET